MIASSFTSAALITTCSVSGRTTCRLRLRLAPARLVPAALVGGFDWLAVSVYEPVISKLLAEARVSAAPFSRARVVGWPRPKGRVQADNTANHITLTANASVRRLPCERELEFAKAVGSVTGCIL